MRSEDFTTGLIFSEKAVTEHDGDLFIEGWAADIGIDDQDEYFDAKALEEAASDFMSSGNTPLLYHHKPDHQLGEILILEPRQREDGSAGLWMKARVDEPAPSHPVLADVYRKIKRGTMKGLSVAGRFFGEPTSTGWRIGKASFREVSVTPFPVNPRTLATVAQKAFEDPAIDPNAVAGSVNWPATSGTSTTGTGTITYEAHIPCTDCEERAKAEQTVSGLKETVRALSEYWEWLQYKAAPTAEQRKKYGMRPDGAFPVWKCGSGPGSVGSAMKLRGHGKNHSAESVLAHIQAAARRLGCPDQAKVGSKS